MTQRDFIKSRLPFVQAMAEGKTVECKTTGTEWAPVEVPHVILADWWELRIPPTPEEERLEKYRALYEEWKRERFKVECRLPFGDWFNESNPKEAFDGVLSGAYNLELRRKPAPSYTPWTFETAPGTQMKVKAKGKEFGDPKGLTFLAEFRPSHVHLFRGDLRTVTYAELLRDFEQLDGSACGEEAK